MPGHLVEVLDKRSSKQLPKWLHFYKQMSLIGYDRKESRGNRMGRLLNKKEALFCIRKMRFFD